MSSSRELLLMRHAKSDWSTGADSDFVRPLNARGNEAAPRMGRWLVDNALIPDRVVSSPATRAQQTAQWVCSALSIEHDAIHWERSIYEASLADLLALVERFPASARRVLLIGHNPGLERLVRHWGGVKAITDDDNLMPTAAIAHFRYDGEWAALDAEQFDLVTVQRARALGLDD